MLDSLASSDLIPTTVETSSTIMAGLNCGSPSPVAWPFIRDRFDAFIAIDDRAARSAMQTYYYPTGTDTRIVSGESGAATLGALLEILKDSELKAAFNLDQGSRIWLLNTEGDTDPDAFSRIVERSTAHRAD